MDSSIRSGLLAPTRLAAAAVAAAWLTGSAGAQIVPPERLIPWDAGVRGGIPAVAFVGDVRDHGATGDGVTDDGPAFNAAIQAATTPGFVWVPPGTYRIATILQLKSGIVLQGAGPALSRLLFDLSAYGFRGGIEMNGTMDAAETPALAGYQFGSTRLVLESVAGIAPGTLLWLFQDDDAAAMYTADFWRTDYGVHSMGQLVGVAAVNGDELTLDVPLRLDYQAALSPRVRIVRPIERAGVEGLYLERLDAADAYTISATHAQNCWVRFVESRRSYRAHLWAFFSRFLTVASSYFHEAWDYGDGGHGYGVTLADCTSDTLVTDNIFHTLRHALMVKEGANGNVLSYNYSFDNRLAKADGSCHGHYNYANLFEGNVMRQIVVADWWGPSGPRTTLLRNRLSDAEGVSVRDHSHDTNVVGNTTPRIEIRRDPDLIVFGYPVYMGEVRRELVDGNLIGGAIVWDGTPQEIPASYSLSGPPDFWGALPWPAVGADVDLENDPDLDIPAQRRYDLILEGQWSPPIPEILQQDPLVAGAAATLAVSNLDPGEEATFLYGLAGLGEGPCLPALGGLCVDVLQPGLLGRASADAAGVARLVIAVPPGAGGRELSTQAVVRRCEAGADSAKTNAIRAVVAAG